MDLPPRPDEPTSGSVPPPPGGPSHRAERWSRIRRWLLVAAAVAAAGLGLGAILSGRPLFAAAAWTFASLPVVYAIVGAVRTSERAARLGRAGSAVALAGFLGFSTLVASQSCTQRLDAGADLSGCDFSGVDLAGRDLSRSDLTGADLAQANLRNANLNGANLTHADLSDAALRGASFRNADLESATLKGATVGNADFAHAVLDRADLRELDLFFASLDDVSLAGAKLDGADLSQTSLAGRNLEDASLKDTNLKGTDLTGANLARAVLDGASMERAQLATATLAGASLQGTDLTRALLDGADLDGATFEGAVLDEVSLVGATGFSDEALAGALNVDLAGLGSALIQQGIRLESRDSILAAVGAACRGGAVPEAGGFPQGSFHPLVVLDGSGRRGAFTDKGSRFGWEPMAVRFVQLVACVNEEDKDEVQTCPYTLQNGGGFASIQRNKYRREVQVVAARSGRSVFQQTIEGSDPAFCPFTNVFYGGSHFDTIDGSHVGFERFRPKLESLVK